MKNKKDSEEKFPYLPICMCLGLSIGCAFGVIYSTVGLCIGVLIGFILEQKNNKEE